MKCFKIIGRFFLSVDFFSPGILEEIICNPSHRYENRLVNIFTYITENNIVNSRCQ